MPQLETQCTFGIKPQPFAFLQIRAGLRVDNIIRGTQSPGGNIPLKPVSPGRLSSHRAPPISCDLGPRQSYGQRECPGLSVF